MNPQAEQAKDSGNDAVKRKEFAEAAQHYTTAINLDGSQSTYYSNRALAYIQLNKFTDALKDSEKAVELAPNVWRVCLVSNYFIITFQNNINIINFHLFIFFNINRDTKERLNLC